MTPILVLVIAYIHHQCGKNTVIQTQRVLEVKILVSSCLENLRFFKIVEMSMPSCHLDRISSSGRLQLHDRTSSIDVLTPDLLSHRNASRICEVFDYYLIVDGIHESMLHMLFLRKTLRCRSVANPIPLAIENTLPLPLPLPILRI